MNFQFFIGLSEPSHLKHFTGEDEQVMINYGRLRGRKSGFAAGRWLLDSGAFSEIGKHQTFLTSVEEYAEDVLRLGHNGQLLAASPQDWMCEPDVIQKTGLSVREHQRRTIERYDQLVELVKGRVYILPVIQGYQPEEYAQHIKDYGGRLKSGAWVAVGSVCKRNRFPMTVEDILLTMHKVRRDLRIHGFGLKITALYSGTVREHLHSSDSEAWSYEERANKWAGIPGSDPNDWRKAKEYQSRVADVLATPVAGTQTLLFT